LVSLPRNAAGLAALRRSKRHYGRPFATLQRPFVETFARQSLPVLAGLRFAVPSLFFPLIPIIAVCTLF